MSNSEQSGNEKSLGFYISSEHECNYLPEQKAKTLFVDPAVSMNVNMYTTLANLGFRRSGNHVYKPRCAQCNACIAIRLPVNTFTMNRNQKRTWSRNNDLKMIKMSAGINDEYFNLYQRYLTVRHPQGGMDNPDPESFTSFLSADWTTTVFYEFRQAERLLAIAVVDELLDGLSAVYTFYDPNDAARSLGRYAILAGIEAAREQGLHWFYLGYWIADCKKMQYKDEYQPLEYFYQDEWHKIPPSA